MPRPYREIIDTPQLIVKPPKGADVKKIRGPTKLVISPRVLYKERFGSYLIKIPHIRRTTATGIKLFHSDQAENDNSRTTSEYA